MFRKVDKSLFDGIEEEKDIAKKYNVKYPKDFDCVAQAVWKDVIAYCKYGKRNQAYKVMFIDGDTLTRKWFFMSPKEFGYLQRWNRHCEERVAKGASYRDAWDVHWWLANSIPEALHHLKNDLHGYPVCAVALWNKLAEITGDEKLDEAVFMEHPEAHTESGTLTEADMKSLCIDENDDKTFSKLDEFRFQTWKKSIERIEFLFREYNEDTCSKKNPYKFEWHYDWKPVNGGKFSEMVWNGTDEQLKEHEKYMSEAQKLDLYRADCLHKAMKILEIFLEYLWD